MPSPQNARTQKGVVMPSQPDLCRYRLWTAAKGPAELAVSLAPWAKLFRQAVSTCTACHHAGRHQHLGFRGLGFRPDSMPGRSVFIHECTNSRKMSLVHESETATTAAAVSLAVWKQVGMHACILEPCFFLLSGIVDPCSSCNPA